MKTQKNYQSYILLLFTLLLSSPTWAAIVVTGGLEHTNGNSSGNVIFAEGSSRVQTITAQSILPGLNLGDTITSMSLRVDEAVAGTQPLNDVVYNNITIQLFTTSVSMSSTSKTFNTNIASSNGDLLEVFNDSFTIAADSLSTGGWTSGGILSSLKGLRQMASTACSTISHRSHRHQSSGSSGIAAVIGQWSRVIGPA